MNTTNSPASITIKPHPREVVREFLEACRNYGHVKFYFEVLAEIEEQVPGILGTSHKREVVKPIYRKP